MGGVEIMRQVKVFTYADSNRLEKNLNKWLKEECCNSDCICSIQYQISKEKSLTVYGAMVVYETI